MKTTRMSEKSQQSLLYIASKLTESRNMYKVLKVIYFADIKHLFKYGRLISKEDYVAMQHGPVPNRAYNMVKNVRSRNSLEEYGIDSVLFTVGSDDTIVPLTQPNLSCFSKSDLECLDMAIEECRPLSFTQLKNKSHDEAYKKADYNDFISIESIAAMAPGEKDNSLLDHILNRHVSC